MCAGHRGGAAGTTGPTATGGTGHTDCYMKVMGMRAVGALSQPTSPAISGGAAATDAGLKHLAGLRRLRVLHANDCPSISLRRAGGISNMRTIEYIHVVLRRRDSGLALNLLC